MAARESWYMGRKTSVVLEAPQKYLMAGVDFDDPRNSHIRISSACLGKNRSSARAYIASCLAPSSRADDDEGWSAIFSNALTLSFCTRERICSFINSSDT